MAIDISLLRELLRNELEMEELLNFLDRAIELLPEERLPELIEGFFDPDLLKVEELSEQSLLEEVQDFHSDSLDGLYYEDFEVNSKNFMERSRGTMNWIAQYNRLMKRCQKESSKGEIVSDWVGSSNCSISRSWAGRTREVDCSRIPLSANC